MSAIAPSLSSALGPNAVPSCFGVGCDLSGSSLYFYSKCSVTTILRITTPFSCATPSAIWFSLTISNFSGGNVVFLTLNFKGGNLQCYRTIILLLQAAMPKNSYFCPGCPRRGKYQKIVHHMTAEPAHQLGLLWKQVFVLISTKSFMTRSYRETCKFLMLQNASCRQGRSCCGSSSE